MVFVILHKRAGVSLYKMTEKNFNLSVDKYNYIVYNKTIEKRQTISKKTTNIQKEVFIMTMTREQIAKANAKMADGWTLDMRSLLFNKEKNPTMILNTDDKHYIKAQLTYMNEREGYSYTGYKTPMLHLSYWTDCGNGMAQSQGLGAWIAVGEKVKRGTLANLSKLTHEYGKAKIRGIAEIKMPQLLKETVL